jgi:hypothetical protein
LISIRTIAFVVFWQHILLGAFKKYPFVVNRTSLFFAPILMFLTADALRWLKGKNHAVYVIVQYSFVLYLLCVSLGIAAEIFAFEFSKRPALWQ